MSGGHGLGPRRQPGPRRRVGRAGTSERSWRSIRDTPRARPRSLAEDDAVEQDELHDPQRAERREDSANGNDHRTKRPVTTTGCATPSTPRRRRQRRGRRTTASRTGATSRQVAAAIRSSPDPPSVGDVRGDDADSTAITLARPAVYAETDGERDEHAAVSNVEPDRYREAADRCGRSCATTKRRARGGRTVATLHVASQHDDARRRIRRPSDGHSEARANV